MIIIRFKKDGLTKNKYVEDTKAKSKLSLPQDLSVTTLKEKIINLMQTNITLLEEKFTDKAEIVAIDFQ